MVTSITQAKPLLTAAELELFDHSRATPIKAFTAKQLAGKEKRVRALRDKYRDLYRRQTLAQRGKASKGAVSAVKSNERTQRKSDIMQEVLERFEARSTQLAAREERESANTVVHMSVAKAPVKSTKKPTNSTAASKPVARSKQAGAKAAAPASKKVAAKSPAQKPSADRPASKTPVSKAAPTKPQAKPAARQASRTAATVSSRKPKDTEHAISALAHLQDGDGGVHVDHLTGQDPTQRSTKAPSKRAPSYGGKAQPPDINAPLDIVASAKRGNPVREMPGNIAIQGHQSSAIRRAQGKRDSR